MGRFGRVSGGVQDNTPLGWTSVRYGITGDSPIWLAGCVLLCVSRFERLQATASSRHKCDIFPAYAETDEARRID